MTRRHVPLWLMTTVLAVSGMATALQFTLTVPLLPTMPEILGVTPNDASWVVTVTLLASAVTTPIFSRMADMYGKRRMILLALGAMTIGSVVVALGASYPTMIIGRALQGFGQSLIPVGISLLRDLLPKERVGSAVALMSATLGIGAALGMPLSGLLYGAFGWQSVFWFTGAAGALFMLGVFTLVNESPLRTPARFDIAGALLLSVILTALLLVISKAGRWEAAVTWGLIGVAVLGLAGWIPSQLRGNNPMVDLRTMSRRPVVLTNVSALFATAPTFANMLITLQQVQAPSETGYGFGLSVVAAGLVMLPSGIVIAALAPLSGALLNRWGGRFVLIAGNAVMAAAFVFRVLFADNLIAIVVGATVAAIGTAFVFAAMPTLIMGAVPLTETASANGINSLVRAIAMSVCSAFIALLVSTMFVTVDGHEFLSRSALELCFMFAAASALTGGLIALFIPVDARAVAPSPIAGDETLIRGRVVLDANVVPRHPATVTFMHLDGAPADWSRADLDGRYSAVLPGPGRYLVVGNAVGWAPQTHVIDVAGPDFTCDVAISEQLSLSGTVKKSGSATGKAIVALHRWQGDFVTSVTCDDTGTYRMPLPLAGAYIATAIGPQGSWAHSRKLIVGVQSTILDIEAPA